MLFKYDLFISYATENKNIADYIVEKIEKRGYKCFIAPRDIRTGSEYATEIISGISNSAAVLLVFSSKSDKSHYVLREINSDKINLQIKNLSLLFPVASCIIVK